MHELGLMEAVVSSVVERLGEARVRRVCLEVGVLTAVAPDALRFCFDVCAQGTTLDGATLEIVSISAQARCRQCTDVVALEGPLASCPCGAYDLEILAGDQLRIREVEVV